MLRVQLVLASLLFAGCGSRVNESVEGWRPISVVGAPQPRFYEVNVWSGSELLVWGGYGAENDDGQGAELTDGGRYDPLSDAWRPMSTEGTPSPRVDSAAVWTGSEMLVWGGQHVECEPCIFEVRNDGGRYDPVADLWAPMSTTSAPEARYSAGAAWTGSEMIVHGGWVPISPDGNSGLRPGSGGGAYSPDTDTWRSLSTEGDVELENLAFVVWTGNELIVWDGRRLQPPRPGGRYDPSTDQWTPMAPHDAELAAGAVAWVDGALIALGFDGAVYARYDPRADRWEVQPTDVSFKCPSPIWSGQELILWAPAVPTALRFDPISGTVAAMTRQGEPTPRSRHAAFWTGTEMLVWGGEDAASNEPVSTGGLYRPPAP